MKEIFRDWEICWFVEKQKEDDQFLHEGYYPSFNKLIQAIKEEMPTEEEIEKVKGNLMYAFPQKSYTNSQIIAYQRGLEQLAHTIRKLMEEKLGIEEE